MSEPPGEQPPDNPYAVRPDHSAEDEAQRHATPRPDRPMPAPHGDQPRPQLARDTVRRIRRAVLTGAMAALLAVLLPPTGLLLGVLALVLGVRLRRDPQARHAASGATLMPLLSGAFAVVVGGMLTALAVFLSAEVSELRDCLAGANTRIAEQACQDEFRQRVAERLPAG